MPIRTNRGRAAVYRRLWGWPLRSPRHLAVTIIGFAVLIAVVSVVVPNAIESKTTAAGTTSAPPTTGAGQVGVLPASGATTTPPPTKAASPTSAPPTAAVAPEAQIVAENWAEAFVSFKPGTTKEAWLKGLESYTSTEFFPQLASIDPANAPTVIKGVVKSTKSFTDSVEFEVPLESGKLLLTVVKRPEGWRVHRYDKVG
ncbi:hypothetical protein GCM10022243_40020 [Saccharothrix violaceirubra]|uniref:Uncharacterized protein n=1 Tax=Saccharothrix violaceirubra TaxID=413306 RepID=A0A7W7T804_9PSEU|nr:hypothetical protein [Saccharothrix violaceirubra]MBB4968258.1 hypothetical protein [Saccharothrix violaceirubra]